MKCPIFIQTKFGASLYEIVSSQYNQYMRSNTLSEYKLILTREKSAVSKQITKFIYDADMQEKYTMEDDDAAGWKLFKELSDKYAILNYFETRKE